MVSNGFEIESINDLIVTSSNFYLNVNTANDSNTLLKLDKDGKILWQYNLPDFIYSRAHSSCLLSNDDWIVPLY